MGALRAGCWLVCRRQLLVAAYPGYELSTTATSCYDPPTHHEAVRGGRFGARLGVRVLQRHQHLVQLLALAVVQCAHLRFLAAGSTGQRAAQGGLGNVVEVPSSAGNDWMGPKRLRMMEWAPSGCSYLPTLFNLLPCKGILSPSPSPLKLASHGRQVAIKACLERRHAGGMQLSQRVQHLGMGGCCQLVLLVGGGHVLQQCLLAGGGVAGWAGWAGTGGQGATRGCAWVPPLPAAIALG